MQALDEAAEYTIDTASYEPLVHTKKEGCSRLDRYCPSTSAWGAYASYEHLEVASSAARGGGRRGASWAAPALLLLSVCAVRVRRGRVHRTSGRTRGSVS